LSRLRYFDPKRRRAGLPEDVAALVEKLTGDSVTVTLININQIDGREVVLQAGGYGEHRFLTMETNGKKVAVNGPHFTVRLAAGAGARLTIGMRRYVNQPSMAFPWDRSKGEEKKDEK